MQECEGAMPDRGRASVGRKGAGWHAPQGDGAGRNGRDLQGRRALRGTVRPQGRSREASDCERAKGGAARQAVQRRWQGAGRCFRLERPGGFSLAEGRPERVPAGTVSCGSRAGMGKVRVHPRPQGRRRERGLRRAPARQRDDQGRGGRDPDAGTVLSGIGDDSFGSRCGRSRGKGWQTARKPAIRRTPGRSVTKDKHRRQWWDESGGRQRCRPPFASGGRERAMGASGPWASGWRRTAGYPA